MAGHQCCGRSRRDWSAPENRQKVEEIHEKPRVDHSRERSTNSPNFDGIEQVCIQPKNDKEQDSQYPPNYRSTCCSKGISQNRVESFVPLGSKSILDAMTVETFNCGDYDKSA